jgi:Uma2 family endonuclease
MTHTPVRLTFSESDRPPHPRPATWADYLALTDDPSPDRIRIFFDEGWMWTEMGEEGLNHATVSDLFTMIIAIWKAQHPQQVIHSLGRCQLEKTGHQACAPDLIFYLDTPPRWEVGQRRYVNLDIAGLPALVGEVSDTTLANDLDRKKSLYAALGIREYWVIDVLGRRILAFLLQPDGSYFESDRSQVFPGLDIALLEQTVERLDREANTDAALWFFQQITR